MPLHLKIFCIILQVFSSLVVMLFLLLLSRLSCMFHQQGRHALCLHYLMTDTITLFLTLFPRAAFSVADITLRKAAYSGHQARAPGRRLLHWMSSDGAMSPGHHSHTPEHTSWEVRGSPNFKTTTLVKNDGTVEQGFPLKYEVQ